MAGDKSLPVLAGHPFAPIGRGEVVRSLFCALKSTGLTLPVRDIYPSYSRRDDSDFEQEFAGQIVRNLSDCVNIFYVNGDEIDKTLSYVRNELPSSAYNIVCPTWELGIYPQVWAAQVGRFDEVWTESMFVFDTIKKAVSKPVFYMPNPVQINLSCFLGRRYFGIPESSYIFLFLFDFKSYIDRKNPYGVLEAFQKVCDIKPDEDMRLVIKISGSDSKPDDYRVFKERLDGFNYRDRVIIINKTLSNNEIKNLIRCGDCFVSLHRSEGFGLGMAEAMFLGKPVVATAWSGNLDFMKEDNSCLVRYKLIPVQEGQYLYTDGQVWAEPDVDHAVDYMFKLLSDKEYGRRLGSVASRHIRQFYSYRAVGLRSMQRLAEIIRNREACRG